jgi:hypothetical protein
MTSEDQGSNPCGLTEREHMTPENKTTFQLEQEVIAQKRIVRKLYGTIVRCMVLMKNGLRLGTVGALWFWIGHKEAYALAVFIFVMATIQLAIDKTRKTAHPELNLSEWDID